MPETDYKRCRKCQTLKPANDFHRCKANKDGLQNRCKSCHIAAVRAWQNANPIDEAERKKRWKDENRRRLADNKKHQRDRYEEKYPEKARAQRAVRHAVRRGRLLKPDRCDDCHQPFEQQELHGHHEDYSKPLEVEWLCSACHVRRHAKHQGGRSMMRTRLYTPCLALLTCSAVLMLIPGVVHARVIEAKHLAAKTRIKTWESRPLSATHTWPYAHIYRRGTEVPQRWINSCNAHYVAGGLIVRLKVINCDAEKGQPRYSLRFVSVTGRQAFLVRLTTTG